MDPHARLGQIAAIYQAFGVRVSANERELPDHIGAELEFAALLCVKEALAETDEEREVSARARQVFTEEHLGRWVPAFAAKLTEQATHPFYRGLAGILVETVAADLAEHGWTASEDAVGPVAAEDEAIGCAIGG